MIVKHPLMIVKHREMFLLLHKSGKLSRLLVDVISSISLLLLVLKRNANHSQLHFARKFLFLLSCLRIASCAHMKFCEVIKVNGTSIQSK